MAVTPLTVYFDSFAASAVVATANQLGTATGGTTGVTISSLIGTATGFGELWSQGNAGAWLGHSGAITDAACNPTGHGWFLDATTLDGKSFPSGNWTTSFGIKTSTGTATADVYVRIFRYNAGVYTLLGTTSITAQAFSTTINAMTFAAVSFGNVYFQTGTKLYIDAWANITAAGVSGETLIIRESTSSGTGTSAAAVITPGYGTTATKNGLGRFLVSIQKIRSGIGRFKLSVQKARTGIGRILIKSQNSTASNGIGRIKNAITTIKNGLGRFYFALSGIAPLTVYPNDVVASSTLSTANQLIVNATSNISADTPTSTVDNNTGFGEIHAQSGSGTWASGVLNLNITPTGKGWFLDGVFLDGKYIVPGNWSASFRAKVSAHSLTADMYCRAYVYNNGTYTKIGVLTLAGQSVATGSTIYTFQPTYLTSSLFPVGSKLYIDVWWNILTTTCLSGDQVRFNQSNVSGAGLPTVWIVTPGYAVKNIRSGLGRFKLLVQPFSKSIGRLSLGLQAIKKGVGRVLLSSKRAFTGIGRFNLGGPSGSVAPLTLYMNTATSNSSATGRQLLANAVISANAQAPTTLIGTATGYDEVRAGGNVVTWAAGSVNTNIAPSWRGFFLDGSLLDAQAIVSGGWSITIKVATSANSLTGDFYCRVYAYKSGLFYTKFGVLTLTAQVFTTTPQTFIFPTATLPTCCFQPGSRLYVDFWLNVTSSTFGPSDKLTFYECSDAGDGLTGANIATPGYTTFTIQSGVGRLIAAANTLSKAVGRVKFGIAHKTNGLGRVATKATTTLLGKGRVLLSLTVKKNGIGRTNSAIARIRSGGGRAAISSLQNRRGVGRVISAVKQLRNGVGRIGVAGSRYGVGRARSSITGIRNGVGRVYASLRINKKGSGRFNVAIPLRNALGRFPFGVQKLRVATGRAYTVIKTTLKGTGRVRNVALTTLHGIGRNKVVLLTKLQGIGRFLLSPPTYRNGRGRFLYATTTIRKAIGRLFVLLARRGTGRVAISALLYRNGKGRAPLAIQNMRKGSGRHRFGITTVKRAVGRMLLLLARRGTGRFNVSTKQFKNFTGRTHYGIQRQRLGTGRAYSSGLQNRRGIGRAPAGVQRLANGKGRIAGSAQRQSRGAGRACFGVRTQLSTTGRFEVLARKVRAGSGRFTLSLTRLKLAIGRVAFAIRVQKNGVGRMLEAALTRGRSTGRVFIGVKTIRTGTGRTPFGARAAKTGSGRYRCAGVGKQNSTGRNKLFASNNRVAMGRSYYSSARVFAAIGRIVFHLPINTYRGKGRMSVLAKDMRSTTGRVSVVTIQVHTVFALSENTTVSIVAPATTDFEIAYNMSEWDV